MSLRGCVLGNSHMAAFVTAKAKYSHKWDGISLDMFGAHGDVLASFQEKDGWFTSDDAEAKDAVSSLIGRSEFFIGDYDFFVITGLGFSIFPIIRVFREFSTLQMSSVNSHADALEYDRSLASTAMLREYSVARLSNTLGFGLAARMADLSDVPVFLASQPRPSARAIEMGERYLGFTQLYQRGEGEFVSSYFAERASEACAAANVTFVDQNSASIDRGLFTVESQMVGSVRLAKKQGIGHGSEDMIHANGVFGQMMIDQISQKLKAG